MVETGTVVEVQPDGFVVVEVTRKTACESCHAKASCSPDQKGRINRITAQCRLNAAPGDQVEIEIADGAFMQAVLWAYVVPSALLILGAFIVWYAVEGTALDAKKDILAALGALAGAGVGVIALRLANNWIKKPGTSQNARFVVRVVKVLAGADQ
jgi:positive regulator of sigma E activity